MNRLVKAEAFQKQAEQVQAMREKQAQGVYAQGVEAVTGMAPSPEIEPYFGEARALTTPGAEVTAQVAGGENLMRRPAQTSDIQAAVQRGVPGLRAATTAEGAALPQTPEGEDVRGAIARGTLKVPSAVQKRYEESLKSAQAAQTLEEKRQLQAPQVRQAAAVATSAELTAQRGVYENEIKRIESIYKQPQEEAALAEKQASLTRTQMETRKVAGEIGAAPLTPGSPQALAAQEKQADLEKKQLDAQKARIEMDQHARYLKAMDDFRRTGDIGHLNRAITFASNGAVETSNLILRGEADDRQRQEFQIKVSKEIMDKKLIMQEHLNKKGDFSLTKQYVDDLNQLNFALSTISRSPNVDWRSVRQEEGMGGAVKVDNVTVTREEAAMLRSGQARPDNAPGLALLLKANYGDIVNRVESGDKAAYDQLILAAQNYPGATKDAVDAVVSFIQRRQQSRAPAAAPEPARPRAPQASRSGEVLTEP